MSVFDPLLVLLDGDDTARWNFPAAVGTPLANPGGLGTAAAVTYSFLTAFPAGYTPAHAAPATPFVAMDAAMQGGVRQALAAWSAVADIGFTEVSAAGAGGDLRFGRHAMAPGGYAYFPSYGLSYGGTPATIHGVGADPLAGDVYIATYPENADLAPGQYGYGALLHEIGHAIGLKHPFEGSLVLPTATDTLAYTVMSYTAPANAGIVTVTGNAASYGYGTTMLEPLGPMLYDIAAAQYLYGANMAHATGDDRYAWATDARFFQTIWDAGGTDIIDASNQTLGCAIDLVDGHFSSIGLRTTTAELRREIPAFAAAAPDPTYDGHDNLAIAFGAMIENAAGGSGADTLTGNALANLLSGNAGNDSLDGGPGADTLIGGTGNDTYHVDSPADLILENPGEGTDTVIATASTYLTANLEALTLATGAGSLYGVGNDLANTLTGNEAANLLIGMDGADTILGDLGDDTLYGVAGADSLAGGGGADFLIAGDGADTLAGGDGADVLYGEAGADSLAGGAALDYLIAGEGDDTLDGGTDADVLYGEAGNDSLTGGTDFVFDQLVGGDGNDTLDGASGLGDFDYLFGGSGDDAYRVDTPADLVFEFSGEGNDTVFASINGGGYYLYAEVEDLVLLGTTPFGVGNGLANHLTGNAAGNYLLGGGGDDTLDGQGGGDVLFGEAGADTFVFQRGTGGDVIGDFAAGVDHILLSGLGFTSFAQVRAAMIENGGTTAVNLGQGDFIVINGVAVAALQAPDFLYA